MMKTYIKNQVANKTNEFLTNWKTKIVEILKRKLQTGQMKWSVSQSVAS